MRAMGWIAGAMGGVLAVAALGCGSGGEAAREGATPMAAAAKPAAKRDTNAPPQIESVRFDPETPVPGQRLRAIARATDPDGDPVTLTYAWTAGGSPMAETGPEVTLGDLHRGDRIEVSVTASDGHAQSDPVVQRVTLGNRVPQVVAVAIDPPGTIRVGQKLTAKPDAEDPDGDSLGFRFTWLVNGQPAETTDATFDTSGLHRGDHVKASVVATDDDDESAPVESADIVIANSPPTITSAPGAVGAGGVFDYQVTADDVDGDRNFRFRLSGAPAGMAIDPVTGHVSWKPTPEQTGKHTVDVMVDDGQGGTGTQRFDLEVAIAPPTPAAAPTPTAETTPKPATDDGRAAAAPTPTAETTPNPDADEGDEAAAQAPAAQPTGRRGRAAAPPAAPADGAGAEEPAADAE